MDFCFEGNAVNDCRPRAGVSAILHEKGFLFRDGPNGKHAWLPTDRPPRPGAKVYALAPLTPLLEGGFVEPARAGGGAVHCALSVAAQLRPGPAGGTVHLLDAGTPSDSLVDLCKRAGVRLHSFGRHACPCSVIVPHAQDRVIVRERVSAASTGLSDRQLRALARAVSAAGAVVSVSSKDRALATATLGLGNGARRYCQPGGALGREETLLLLAMSHGVVGNLQDFAAVGRMLGLPPVGLDERAPGAFALATGLLKELRRRGLAGKEVAVLTLGRAGCVVADWQRRRAYSLRLELSDDSGPPTAPGAGDRWLSYFVLYRETWLSARHFRDPEAAVAARATHAVARWLGLGPGQYDLATGTPLPA